MDWLNYRHLYYFWMTAKEGSIAAACRHLRLSQPTISAQLKSLERSLGVQLFARTGRRMVLTEAGRTAYRRAEEIFHAGRELVDVLHGQAPEKPARRVSIGIVESVPKLLAFRLIERAFRRPENPVPVCVLGKQAELLARLSVHGLDLVVTDSPIGQQAKIRAYNHTLGEFELSVFGAQRLAQAHGAEFPHSLQAAPFLMPAAGTPFRRLLEGWFEEHGVRVSVAGEFEDSTMLKAFGQAGFGLFAMPSVEKREVCAHYGVRVLGPLLGATQRFYAISTERRVRNPAVVAITEGVQLESPPSSG
jgi:LysR family transcriptional activator of nhaA